MGKSNMLSRFKACNDPNDEPFLLHKGTER